MHKPHQRTLTVSMPSEYLARLEAAMLRLTAARGRFMTKSEITREALDRFFGAELSQESKVA